MATAQSLIDDVRSRIVEPTASFFTDAEILRWLNQGYKNFIAHTEWAEKCKAYPVSAYQFEYTLPTDIMKIYDIRWQDKWKVFGKDQEEWGSLIGAAGQTPGPRPYMWRQFPWSTTLRINPYPSSASATTTLTSGATSSDTSISVASTSTFPRYGRLNTALDGSGEQIFYYNTSSTAFLQCVRGDGSTTAASILNGATLYAAPLEVYMQYQPADLATSPAVGTAIGPSYDEALINYACHVAMLKRERYEQSQLFKKMYDEILDKAVVERRKMQMDRLFVIKDEDTIGPYTSWV